jgi:hypothetical protein
MLDLTGPALCATTSQGQAPVAYGLVSAGEPPPMAARMLQTLVILRELAE